MIREIAGPNLNRIRLRRLPEKKMIFRGLETLSAFIIKMANGSTGQPHQLRCRDSWI